ncbi:hypothetical protein I3760_15G059700 [Carya illinoinensis]|uniref:EF-hand domain-containing protein n=1 Tax=Carya illinoinensis TaxID=32201 RepID=A0A8T1N9S5_CARIL|nr:hypothetical protein I3760_15G059700 [Carya illinoinensis]KAG6626591.1 hypothetical protein CIPAW_15G060700 [Carya illinoinensis]
MTLQVPKALSHEEDLPDDEEKLALMLYFKKKDANKDRFLSKEELQAGFKELGSIIPTKLRAKHALNHADRIGDGVISVDDHDQELRGVVEYALRRGFNLRHIYIAGVS